MKLPISIAHHNALQKLGKQDGFILNRRRNPNTGIDRGTYTGKSLVLDGSVDYLSRTPSAGNDQIWTVSIFVKRSSLGTNDMIFAAGSDANNETVLYFNTNNQLTYFQNTSTAVDALVVGSDVFRDTHKFYHVVCAVDTTQATASDRVRIYVDNVEVTYSGTDYPSSSGNTKVNTAVQHDFGLDRAGVNLFDGYISKVDFIDGLQLTPSAFGHESADTGKWVASDTSGLTFGTNGFSLDFNDDRASTPDTTTTIYDQSTNSNNWTGNSLVTGSFTGDTPVDNYCTMNSLIGEELATTYSNGNLSVSGAGHCLGTLPARAKSYFEYSPADTNYQSVGYAIKTATGRNAGAGVTGGSTLYANTDGKIYVDGVLATTVATYTTTDYIAASFDPDTRVVKFYKNDALVYTTAALSGTDEVTPYYLANAGANGTFDFGASGFSGTLPTGFSAISSANLTAPDNWKPQNNANIVLYTGDGSADLAVTGMGFKPDFTWIKNRDAADRNLVTDFVRGVTKELTTNATTAEATNADGLITFDTDGFSVGADLEYNTNLEDFWSLNILADNTAGSSNTDGTITSTVATDGINFSIVTYTGTGANATVGHGLAEAPDLIIVKKRNATQWWAVYHSSNTSAPETDFLALHLTNATADDASVWNDTATTSSVFSLGTTTTVNGSSDTFVAYCFKFGDVFAGGSYTDNGSVDGAFIPSDELLFGCYKKTDVAGNWEMHDQLRPAYNPADKYLYPNLANSEDIGVVVDFLSNGTKRRVANTGTFIWWGIKKNGGQLAA
jgi:concanavalin A-like lectin/glucanase superfamily protein